MQLPWIGARVGGALRIVIRSSISAETCGMDESVIVTVKGVVMVMVLPPASKDGVPEITHPVNEKPSGRELAFSEH